jgi:hypothetical protein
MVEGGQKEKHILVNKRLNDGRFRRCGATPELLPLGIFRGCCGRKEGFDDEIVEPLKIEGGSGDVNVKEGGIDIGVGGRAGQWGVREKLFGIMFGGAGVAR